MAQACNEYQSLAEETFHMARKSIGMAAPSPASRNKRVVTQGSPHAKKIAKHAGDPVYVDPNECFSPEPGRMPYASPQSPQLSQAGSPGVGVPRVRQKIQPNPFPRPTQAQAPLKSMLKPVMGVIDYKKKRPVWLMRKVVRITYPADQPTAGFAGLPRAETSLKGKQSPGGKKPWEWPGEEKFPGTASQSQKIIKDVKYKLEQVQRKLGERGKGAVRSREPKLAAEKRWDMGNMDLEYMPYRGDTERRAAQGREQQQLRARRQEYGQQHRGVTRQLHAMYDKVVAPRVTRRSPQRTAPQSSPSSACSVYYDAQGGSPRMTRSSARAYTPITPEQNIERMENIMPDAPMTENDWAIVDAFKPVVYGALNEDIKRLEAVKSGKCEDFEKIKYDIHDEIFNKKDIQDHFEQFMYATLPYLKSETNEKLLEERLASLQPLSDLVKKAEADLKRRLCPQYHRDEDDDY